MRSFFANKTRIFCKDSTDQNLKLDHHPIFFQYSISPTFHYSIGYSAANFTSFPVRYLNQVIRIRILYWPVFNWVQTRVLTRDVLGGIFFMVKSPFMVSAEG